MTDHYILRGLPPVSGAALFLVGVSLFIANPLMTRNDALRGVPTSTLVIDGQVHHFTEQTNIDEALAQMKATNASRRPRQKLGAALAMLGTMLLSMRLGLALVARRNRQSRAEFDSADTPIRRSDVHGWVCRQCGETIEAQFDICWKCESPRNGPAPAG